MPSLTYEYQKPQNTYTIEQWIACKSTESMTYHNSSFIDKIDNINYSAYNVVSDYIEDIRNNFCVTLVLSDNEMIRYKYRPKLLCFDLYGDTELAFLLLLLNDMYTVKQFTKNKILALSKSDMISVCNRILNSNRDAIKLYYYNHN